MDKIDIAVCRIFNLSPDKLYEKNRKGPIVLARFAAMYLHYQNGMLIKDIAYKYKRTYSPVAQAINAAKDMIKFDRKYAFLIETIREELENNKQRYNSSLLHQGAAVWSRGDSSGNVRKGFVQAIVGNRVMVNYDGYYQTMDRTTGCVSHKFETSDDIVFIMTE